MKFLPCPQPPGEVIQHPKNTWCRSGGETDHADLGTGKRVQVPKERDMTEVTVQELDAELAEQLPARELMCCRCCCSCEIEIEVEVSCN